MPLKIAAALLALLSASLAAALAMRQGDDAPPPMGPRLGILAIGDSITEGYPLRPPGRPVDRMAEALGGLGYRVTICNRGVGSTSAADWAEDRDGMLTKAMAEAKACGLETGSLAWVTLGTNDAQYGYEAEDFEADLRTLCNRLRSAGFRPVVNVAPWQSPDPRPSAKVHGEPRMELLESINRRILVVASSGDAEAGDSTAYEHFRANPDHLTDGLHPNRIGAIRLGRAWARAAAKLAK